MMKERTSSKIEQIIVLRDYLGLSWWRIAKEVYGVTDRQEIAKKALSAYGQYKKYVERQNKQKHQEEYEIAGNMQERLEFGHPGFRYLSEVETTTLPGTMSYRELKMTKNKRERHKYELLELVDYFYNKIGLAEFDSNKHFLFVLHKNALLVMKYINLDVANAQHINNEVKRSANVEALGFIYVVFELTLVNTHFYSFMSKVWKAILEFMPQQKRRREKKINELVERIAGLEKAVAKHRIALLVSV